MTKLFYEQITPNRALPFRLLIHDTGIAHTVLRHWHKSYELDFVLKGINRHFILNEQEFDQQQKELVVVNPYEVHGLKLPLDHNRIAITVMLPVSFVNTAGISLGTLHIQNRIKNDLIFNQIFSKLYNTVRRNATKGTQATQISLVYQLLAHLLDTYSTQQKSSIQKKHITTQMDHLTPALNWIENHFSEKITIPKLAELANISPSYFAHLFKTYLQQTPLNYIEECRLLEAQKKLINTNESIESIASLCGFSSSKALNQVLKSQLGLTARQFRKKTQNYL